MNLINKRDVWKIIYLYISVQLGTTSSLRTTWKYSVNKTSQISIVSYASTPNIFCNRGWCMHGTFREWTPTCFSHSSIAENGKVPKLDTKVLGMAVMWNDVWKFCFLSKRLHMDDTRTMLPIVVRWKRRYLGYFGWLKYSEAPCGERKQFNEIMFSL